jgi:hypothetical protein
MEFTQEVRLAIYEMTVGNGRVPSVEELAKARGFDADRVEDAFRALADAHVIVLERNSTAVWSAPPFSAGQTPFHVRPLAVDSRAADTRSWCAPCAWDAFGIPAVLKQDVTINATCAESGVPLPSGVRLGQAVGAGIIHLEVPARHFWDDIFYT